jgi:hypothetical protein
MSSRALNPSLFFLALLISLTLTTQSVPGGQNSCNQFQRAVKATYDFKPSRLSETQRNAKAAAMDRIWELAKGNPVAFLPCLRAELKNPQSDPWFRFDGSNLLVKLDPSPESKAEQNRQHAAVDLQDVDLRAWVSVLAQLGAEGFDVSEAGSRWLSYPEAEYYLPEHGAYKVDRLLGGIFIFGSMDETQATPALLKIAGSVGHPGRYNALSLLLMQATPEAIRGLQSVKQDGLAPESLAGLRAHLKQPILIEPRETPKTSRAQFLKAFNDAAKGDWDYFFKLVDEVPDGEKDVVATLKAEDAAIVRKARRLMIARTTQHAADYYVTFTQILMTLVWRPELVK